MIRRQKELAGLQHIGRDAADADRETTELLREVLKELRQIRGILGHMAKDVSKDAMAGEADDRPS